MQKSRGEIYTKFIFTCRKIRKFHAQWFSTIKQIFPKATFVFFFFFINERLVLVVFKRVKSLSMLQTKYNLQGSMKVNIFECLNCFWINKLGLSSDTVIQFFQRVSIHSTICKIWVYYSSSILYDSIVKWYISTNNP